MANPLRGISHYTNNSALAFLRLVKVDVNVLMVDVSARINLRQTFYNSSSRATGSADYVLPIPPDAIVCAFRLYYADGNYIDAGGGDVQDLSKFVIDNVFTIQVGCIGAHHAVTVELEMIRDLSEHVIQDQITLCLPSTIARPFDMDDCINDASVIRQASVRITVDVQLSGAIRQLFSPSHAVIQAAYISATGKASRRCTTVKLRLHSYLDSDFVVIVRSDGFDRPRCFAQRHPRDPSLVSLQITGIPLNHEALVVPPQEFLFLVDRSSAMEGSRFDAVKDALQIALRMIPAQRTFINVLGIGSIFDSIWSQSQVYSSTALMVASRDIDAMATDIDGTDIDGALKRTMQMRRRNTHTCVLLISNGNTRDIEETMAVIRSAVSAAREGFPLQIYALGIGETISRTALERIAFAGNGDCAFAATEPEVVMQCSRLLCAALAKPSRQFSIGLGAPESVQTVSIRSGPEKSSAASAVAGLKAPALCSSPVFVTTRNDSLAKHVTVRELGSQTEHRVPIDNVRSLHKPSTSSPLLPTLAALSPRKLISPPRTLSHSSATSSSDIYSRAWHASVAGPLPAGVLALVKRQLFDGSFAPSEGFARIVGRRALRQRPHRCRNEGVWAVALAQAFLDRHASDTEYGPVHDGIANKIVGFVESQRVSRPFFAALVAKAKAVVT